MSARMQAGGLAAELRGGRPQVLADIRDPPVHLIAHLHALEEQRNQEQHSRDKAEDGPAVTQPRKPHSCHDMDCKAKGSRECVRKSIIAVMCLLPKL